MHFHLITELIDYMPRLFQLFNKNVLLLEAFYIPYIRFQLIKQICLFGKTSKTVKVSLQFLQCETPEDADTYLHLHHISRGWHGHGYLCFPSIPCIHPYTYIAYCFVFWLHIDFSRSLWWETFNFLMENQQCMACVSGKCLQLAHNQRKHFKMHHDGQKSCTNIQPQLCNLNDILKTKLFFF